MKTAATWALIIATLAIPARAGATSQVACIGKGVEFRASFSVNVTYQGKGLPGASIEVTTSEPSERKTHSEMTGPDGRAHISKLSPGDYWIKAEYLGIAAHYECFHINPSPSSRAKKSRHYEWGDMPLGVREAAGSLIDLQTREGGTMTDRLAHRSAVPIAGAKLQLRQPLSDVTYKAVSDATGNFQFDNMPAGIYVLRIDADSTSGKQLFDSTDFLVEVSHTSRIRTLRIIRGAALGSPRTLSLDSTSGKT